MGGTLGTLARPLPAPIPGDTHDRCRGLSRTEGRGMVPLGFQYLAGVSIIVTWVLVIAAVWRRQRRMILLSAGLAAPHALSALLLVPHYWRPPSVFFFGIALEDVLFMIGVGGMAWVFSVWPVRGEIEVVFRLRSIVRRYGVLMVGTVIAGLALSRVPGPARMTAIIAVMFAISVAAVVFRSELWPMAVAGCLCSGTSYAVAMLAGAVAWPEFMELWHHENLWGPRIGGVPFEEIAWAALFGPSWSLVMALVVDARVRGTRSRCEVPE